MLRSGLLFLLQIIMLMLLNVNSCFAGQACKSLLDQREDPLKRDFVNSFLYENMRFPLSPFALNLDLSSLHLLQGKSRSHEMTLDDLNKAFDVMTRVHNHLGIGHVPFTDLKEVFFAYAFEVPFVMFDALEAIGPHVYNQSLFAVDESTVQLFIAVPPNHEILSIASKIRELLRTPEVTQLSLAHKKEILKGERHPSQLKNISLEALRTFIVPRLILDFPHLSDKVWDGEISKADIIFYALSGITLTQEDEPSTQAPPPVVH